MNGEPAPSGTAKLHARRRAEKWRRSTAHPSAPFDFQSAAGASNGAEQTLRRRRSHQVAAAIGLGGILLGFLVLIGWAFDIPLLRTLLPGLAEMKANTAIAFVFAGAAFVLLLYSNDSGWTVAAAIVCGALTCAIGGLTLVEYIFNADLGIDQLFFEDPQEAGIPPGRPAPITAFNFTLIGAAIVFLSDGRQTHKIAAQIVGIPVIIFSYAVLFGYTLSISALYQVSGFAAVALHTALGQFLLGASIFAASPEIGLTPLLLSPSPVGGLARRLVLISLVLLPAFGWLQLEIQASGLINTEMGVALLIAFSLVAVLTVVLYQTNVLNRSAAEREQLAAALGVHKRAESTFRSLLDAAPDAMVISDRAGKIVLVNSAAEKMFGYDRDELAGQPFEILVPVLLRDQHVGYRKKYLRHPRTRPMGEGLSLAALHKNGRVIPVDIGLSPLTTEAGDLIIASIRDISERVRFTEELKKKNAALEEASKAKDLFLASMSHELRTPLTAIIGYAGTLLMGAGGALTPEQEKQVSVIKTSGKHLLAMIGDVLDLAKIELGKVEISAEPVSPGSVAEEVATTLRPLAEDKGLKLEVVNEAPQPIHTDPRALSQILINLAGNAIKFTDKGEIRIAVSQSGGCPMQTSFAVTDTGCGIKPEDQGKLFDLFRQVGDDKSRAKGSGLGLYISRKLAKLLGGKLSFESAPGVGSTFTLTLVEGE